MKKNIYSEVFSNDKFDQILSFIDQKQYILDKFSSKQEPYYTTRVVKKKERTYVLCFVGEPDVSYETEIIFNGYQLINLHLEEIDKSIQNNNCFYIARSSSTLSHQLSETEKFKKNQTTIIENLNNQVAKTKAELSKIQNENNDLLIKVKPLEAESAKLNNDIQTVQQQINTLPNIKMMVNNPHFEIKEYVANLNDSQRTILLIELWDKNNEDSKITINFIKNNGFNANYVNINGKSLIQWAIDKSSLDLINLIIQQDSSCLEQKELIQYLFKNNSNLEIIEKIISSDVDFSSAMKYLIIENDYQTIERLLEIKPSLIDKLSMYEALKHNRLEIISFILNKNTECDETIIKAIEKNNFSVLSSLFKIHQEAFVLTNIDYDILLRCAVELGDEPLTNFMLSQIESATSSNLNNHCSEFFNNNDAIDDSNLFETNLIAQEIDLSLMHI